MADTIIDTSSSSSTFSASMEQVSSKVMVVVILVLFMVVVFFLFLHLYARWWRSRRAQRRTHNYRSSRRRFNFAPTQDPLVALHKGLEPSLLRDLPVLLFHHDNFKEGLECAVCLSELQDGDKARLLPECNHGFHVDCIDMWFQSHSTCPLCRCTVGEFTPKIQSLQVLSSENTGSRTSGVEQPVETSSSSSSSSSYSFRKFQDASPDGSLVIEIPSRRLTDGLFDSLSPLTPTSRFSGDDMKTPTTTRLRSLRRLLSREKRVLPCSPDSIDVEQGGGGRGQSSMTNSESLTGEKTC